MDWGAVAAGFGRGRGAKTESTSTTKAESTTTAKKPKNTVRSLLSGKKPARTTHKKVTENLRKMGANRPTKPASLRRLLKSLLAAETGDASIEVAFSKLVASGAVAVGTGSEVTYPTFDLQQGAGSTGS